MRRTSIPHQWVSWFIGLNAVVGLGAGIALLILPDVFLTVFGVSTDRTGILVARLFGADLTGFNLATWLARDIRPIPRFLVLGHSANESLSALVFFVAAASGLGNAFVAAFGVIALAFAGGYALLAARVDPG
jgi:hypothetical protein